MNKLLKFIWILMVIALIICIGGILSMIATVMLPLFVVMTPFAIAFIIWCLINP